MSNMRKFAEITDNVVICPSYINIKSQRYCSRKTNIRKYIEVTYIVGTCPTYVNM